MNEDRYDVTWITGVYNDVVSTLKASDAWPWYDKIIEAGKGIWIGIGQGSVDRWIVLKR